METLFLNTQAVSLFTFYLFELCPTYTDLLPACKI